ncbi:hypothetical protein LIER_34543 [Lithospermum erythrorhizon]|uniref:Uncharacterized protein n=1 Tax=Lithospermum erythrorhizon TaxID=34254 RepID=A0AAV3S251_LITER
MEKRKREDKEDINNTRVKACYVDQGLTNKIPLDEEVEEFFVILRRAREAIKYFKKRVNVEEEEEEEERRGHIEDFEGVDNGGVTRKREFEEKYPLLDLNVDPVVDQVMSKST